MEIKALKFYMNSKKWIPTNHQWIQFLKCLNKNDCDYAHSFKFQNDCKTRLLGQLLIRYCLKILTNLELNKIKIERELNGKPYFVNSSHNNYHIDFNLSHSKDYLAICAIKSSIKNKVGIDIMNAATIDKESNENDHLAIKDYERFNKIILKSYTTNECKYIESKANLIDKINAFLRIWTLKESYLKAIGKGIRMELKKLDFYINNELNDDFNSISNTKLFVDSVEITNCTFYEHFWKGNCISICLVNNDPENSRLDFKKKEYFNDGNLKHDLFKEVLIDDLMSLTKVNYNCSDLNYDDYWNLYSSKIIK